MQTQAMVFDAEACCSTPCASPRSWNGALGCKKTDAVLYRQVTQALDLIGEQILFWNDAPNSVAAVHEQGWHAEHYRSFEEFERVLTNLLRRLVSSDREPGCLLWYPVRAST